jgi:hypothetical protein
LRTISKAAGEQETIVVEVEQGAAPGLALAQGTRSGGPIVARLGRLEVANGLEAGMHDRFDDALVMPISNHDQFVGRGKLVPEQIVPSSNRLTQKPINPPLSRATSTVCGSPATNERIPSTVYFASSARRAGPL